MRLIAGTLYDPAVAVTKNTTAAQAMTAMDTTNLRLSVTVPSHGMVRVRAAGIVHGATTFPSILIGVLEGSTRRGRVAPSQRLGNTAVATALVHWEADYVLTGLTPGTYNWDLAWGVETLVASTGIKYGGPDNTSANDAFGGISFEVWDPQPTPTNFSSLSIDSNGRVDVIKVAGTTQTARDIGASVLISPGTGTGQLDVTSGVIKSNLTQIGGSAVSTTTAQLGVNVVNAGGTAWGSGAITAGSIAASALNGKGDWLLSSSYTAPLDAAGTRTAVGLASANLDTQLSGINSKTINLPSDPADASDIAASFSTVNGTLATIAGYIDTEVAAIKAKTDNLPASPAAASDCLTAADVRTAIGLASANLDTQLAAIPTANQNRDAVFSKLIGSTYTFSQVTNLMASRLCGKRTISGDDRIWRDIDDTRNNMTLTVNTSGEVTAATLNPA